MQFKYLSCLLSQDSVQAWRMKASLLRVLPAFPLEKHLGGLASDCIVAP